MTVSSGQGTAFGFDLIDGLKHTQNGDFRSEREMDKYQVFKRELLKYESLIKDWEEFPDKERWFKYFNNLSQNLLQVLFSDSVPMEKRNMFNDLMYFFAPRMGSPSEDMPDDLQRASNQLHAAMYDVLRLLWADEGRKTFSIDLDELYKVGDIVNLIDEKLLSIRFNGYKSYAHFETLHRYQVASIIENDISNMPQYVIKYGAEKIVARHDAIRPTCI